MISGFPAREGYSERDRGPIGAFSRRRLLAMPTDTPSERVEAFLEARAMLAGEMRTMGCTPLNHPNLIDSVSGTGLGFQGSTVPVFDLTQDDLVELIRIARQPAPTAADAIAASVWATRYSKLAIAAATASGILCTVAIFLRVRVLFR
jgi:hypothetical protein